jgi:hypothetical protein
MSDPSPVREDKEEEDEKGVHIHADKRKKVLVYWLI